MKILMKLKKVDEKISFMGYKEKEILLLYAKNKINTELVNVAIGKYH